MAQAQGSIVVRRRPKDGANGQDAVRYWLVPSVTAVKRHADGSLTPSSVTCAKLKQTGNNTPVETAEGTLKYQIVSTNGTAGTETNYTGAVTVSATTSSINFNLYISGVKVATESVPVYVDGIDAYTLDLSNEMAGVACDSDGKITQSTLPTSQATVYKGGELDSGWSFKITPTGCTATITTGGLISVTAMSADTASVLVIASKTGLASLTATMSLYKAKNGKDAVVYSIETDVDSVSIDKNGNLSATTITCTKYKVTGDSARVTTKENTLKYIKYTNGTAGRETSLATTTQESGSVEIDATTTAVVFILYQGGATSTIVLDRERVPIIKDGTDGENGKDGKDGENGKDAYTLDLSNEMAGIACNSSGIVTGDFPSSTATVYRGNTKDTGWSFKVTNTDCTATISAAGVISITAISADTASILVTASKTGYADLTATMSLYKVKPGVNGTTPTIYSIEPNASAVSLDSSGNLFPATLVCYKYAKTGNNARALTAANRLTAIPYNMNGVAQTEQVLSNNGATTYGSIDVKSSWSAVEFILYNGASAVTIIDRERVPIVRDGQEGRPGGNGTDGKDATIYWLVMNTLTVRKTPSGTCTPSTITCKVMKKTGDKDAEEVTGLTQSTALKVKYTRTYSNGSTSSVGYSYTSVTFNSNTESLLFELLDENNNVLASETVIAVYDGTDGGKGDPGDRGLQGCIVRQTIWTSGVAYKNEVNSTSTGIRYLDIAILEVWNNGVQSFYRFQCVTSHTSTSANKPTVGMTANSYWTPLSDNGPLYAPIVLADQAVFKLTQTNQIVVMSSEDKTKVNAAMGGGLYPLWIGAADPMEAFFKVDRFGQLYALNAKLLGEVIAGTEDGQRVALEPDNKAMKIYDANGEEKASFEGNSATAINSLFQNASGSFTLATQASGSDSVTGNDTSGVSRSNTYVMNSGNAIYSTTPIEVTFKGTLFSSYTDPPSSYNSGGGDSPQIMPMAVLPPIQPDPSIQNPTISKTANSYVRVVLKTYNNASRTTLLGQVTVATVSKDSKTFNVKAKSSVGGYHFLVLEYYCSATGSGMSASVAWGTSVTNGTAFSATYTSDFYVARYMGNGLVLGTSQQNYIWLYQQANLYMRMMMESNGYGFDFGNSIAKFKHHGGSWQTLPLLIWRAYVYYSSSNYYTSNAKAPFGSPTISRQGEGIVRITYPDNWKTAFTFNHGNIRVLLTGVGTSSGSSTASLKATLGSLGTNSMDIYLSDDASNNDGAFTIDIEYIGS